MTRSHTAGGARTPLPLSLSLMIGLAVVLGACGYSGSHDQQVREWASSNSYLSNERQVVSDAKRVELAAAKGSALQLRTVCGGLSSDTGTLYDTLPAPDHPLTDQLNAATTAFFDGAELCSVASSTGSSSARRALADVRRGLVALGRADRTLKGFGVGTATAGGQ